MGPLRRDPRGRIPEVTITRWSDTVPQNDTAAQQRFLDEVLTELRGILDPATREELEVTASGPLSRDLTTPQLTPARVRMWIDPEDDPGGILLECGQMFGIVPFEAQEQWGNAHETFLLTQMLRNGLIRRRVGRRVLNLVPVPEQGLWWDHDPRFLGQEWFAQLPGEPAD